MNIKKHATDVAVTSKRVVNNGEAFVQACSLLVVSAFSYWALHQIKLNDTLQWVVTAALVIIGLRGTVEFIKFLDADRK